MGFSRRAGWLLGLWAPLAAVAAEMQYSLDVGLGSSDNIGRAVTGEQDETIASVGTRFLLQQETRRLNANVQGNLAWIDYMQNTFGSELQGNARAAVSLGIVEDLLSWSLNDSFGQTRFDTLAPSRPSNRGNVNYFSTGPDLTWRIAEGTILQATGRYGRVDSEDNQFQSERRGASLGVRRALSGVGVGTLGVSVQKIDPPNSSGTLALNRKEAVAGYEANGARTQFRVEAGAARVETRSFHDTGPVMRLSLSRQFGAYSTLTVRAGRQSSDAGSQLGDVFGDDDLLQAGVVGNDLQRTTNPFVSDSVGLTWRIQGRATLLEIGGDWAMQEMVDDTLPDRRRRQLVFRGTRELGPRLNAGLDLRHLDRSVAGQGKADENEARLSLGWRVGRNLTLAASAELFEFQRRLQPGTAREHQFWLRSRYGTF